MRRRALLIELGLLGLVGVLTWLGVQAAIEGSLAKAAELSGASLGARAVEVELEAQRGWMRFVGGLALIAFARVVSLRRAGRHIDVPWLLPAAAGAVGLGLCLQMGFGDPARAFRVGPAFADGFLLASVCGALMLASPVDPLRAVAPLRGLLPPAIVGTFVALRLFGHGTAEAPGSRIHLGPVQPLEAVKLAFVLFLAFYFGRRAAKLRHQRARVLGVIVPRPRLLIPSLVVLGLLFAGFLVVDDLGPTLILCFVFLAVFYLVTLSGGWVALALALMALLMTAVVQWPAFVDSSRGLQQEPGARAPRSKVTRRVQMWLDPWLNAEPNGDQLAFSRWAIAAGGLTGQGLGTAPAAALPAGHTDLVIAHLAEEGGVLGVMLYLALLGVVALQALHVAARNRTPERMLLAAGLGWLLIAQWGVIFGGTTGLLPLTGVVAPYLSHGKSSMCVFVVLAAWVARLAEDGAARQPTEELAQIGQASLRAALAVVGLLAAGAVVVLCEGVVWGPQTTLRGVVTLLGPGSGDPSDRVQQRYDPRLTRMLRRIPRGPILDRNGRTLARTDAKGRREHPLGRALGTLIGLPPGHGLLRPYWSLERLHDARLRGYGERPDGPAIWLARVWGEQPRQRLLFVVPSRQERPADRARAERSLAAGEKAVFAPLASPDLSAFGRLLRLSRAAREEALNAMAADEASRTVRVTLDGDLQREAAQVVQNAGRRSAVQAAAAVVLDVDTGEVLARAQAPDVNPSDASLPARLRGKDEALLNIYGPWPDRTGLRGYFQAGSVAKLITSLAAVREAASGRVPRLDETTFACEQRDAQGNLFTRPEWSQAIHDHAADRAPHGRLDYVGALAHSCNVYFAQLGLALGPDPFLRLRNDGLDYGFSSFDPGAAGSRTLASTAFGQGGVALNVMQAARLVASVSDGTYRRCPPGMDAGATCDTARLVDDPQALRLILTAMHAVMQAGTAERLRAPVGLRVYGKTGTADASGFKGEERHRIRYRSEEHAPHSWFVALLERDQAPLAQPGTPGRVAIAVVVPRGGVGAGAAGEAAMQLAEKAARFVGRAR